MSVEQSGEITEQRVACRMPKEVVARLEIVQIDKDEGEAVAKPAGPADLLSNPHVKSAAIVQSGETVPHRRILEDPYGSLQFEKERLVGDASLETCHKRLDALGRCGGIVCFDALPNRGRNRIQHIFDLHLIAHPTATTPGSIRISPDNTFPERSRGQIALIQPEVNADISKERLAIPKSGWGGSLCVDRRSRLCPWERSDGDPVGSHFG